MFLDREDEVKGMDDLKNAEENRERQGNRNDQIVLDNNLEYVIMPRI